MRKLETSDFETANIEYVEFWMLDPFIYNPEARGGEMYINLGEVSEDVLKDGKKFYENGMPVTDGQGGYMETQWGRVPTAMSLVYAFDNTSSNRSKQDVGLNGLTSAEEQQFPTYMNYLADIQGRVNADVYESIKADPAGDTYHYFRGDDYDAAGYSILDRYKRFNNTEGNSPSSEGNTNYDKSAKTTPDVEDINQDYTLDEYEKYFEYHVSLRPQDMVVGRNHITDMRTYRTKLRNGNTESVNWYKFRVPIDKYERAVGNIRDFTSIRFMRIYMTGFSEPVIVRLATMELIRGTWRSYDQPIYSAINKAPKKSGNMVVASVNIEENGDRKPVNYTMPPGISRILDPSQPQLRQDNEQALSLQITGLEPNEARAIYNKTNLDLRKYGHVQMYIHAENIVESATPVGDGEMSVFVRLGSDYKSNYYEYEIPLTITPEGYYDGNTTNGCKAVWPEENMLDIDFTKLTELKRQRNIESNANPEISKTSIYSQFDEDNPKNRISIIGNPTVGKIKTVMIGVRNNSRSTKDIEVWLNELRLTGFNNQSGWAAQSALNVQLSDAGSVNMSGHAETAGFGGLEEGVSQRRLDDYYQYAVTTNFDLGRFFPEKLKLSLPFYYSYQQEKTSPLYSPFDTDLYLDDMLETLSTDTERDSLASIANMVTTSSNLSFSNVKMNITSKKPMPYDPSNFSFGFSRSVKDNSGDITQYQHQLTWRAIAGYTYAPAIKAWEPFKSVKSKSKWLDILKGTGINPLPQSFAFNTEMNRNYFELQTRDLENSFGADGIPVTFSQEFMWSRSMDIRWDIMKALKMNFSSATNAEIEEPYVPVNKTIYPDEYEFWKDSIQHSIAQMGRPLDYRQSFSASYQVPINKLPILDWTQLDANFSSSYNWDRGATLANGTTYGNTIANQRSLTVNSKLNLETLYNKVEFLKETNKKFASTKGKRPTTKKKKPKKFTQEVKLIPDSTYTIKHGQKSKRPEVASRTKDGHPYKVKYKVIDENTIALTGPDTAMVKLTIGPGPDISELPWYKAAQYTARALMLVRNVSATYKNVYAMTLPGFMPEAGSILGQRNQNGLYAPGWDFAFGLTGSDYLDRAHNNGWLLDNDSVAYASTANATEELQMKVTLEPARDFKIDLNASWVKTGARSVQFMYAGMPTTQTGTFNMTTITIGSAFERRKADNSYHSDHFNRFVQNLDVVQRRVQQQYAGATYPAGTALEGMPFDPKNGSVGKYSPDVMIPAFLATYTGGNAHTKALDLFPSMLSMLPNWKVTYSGLSKLPMFKKYFKSVNINHSYKSVYSVGSFNTYSTYMEYMNGLGFISDVTTGNPIPSSMFDISAVSINEQFSPLIGIDVTLLNNMTMKVQYNKSRVMNLSMTSVQLVETNSDDIVFGVGYKITNLKLFGGGRRSTGSKGKVSNDLNLRGDFSWRDQSALCRNIQALSTQATSGNQAMKISLSADYTFSRMLTLNAYFDHQTNIPVVSASSYPTSTNDFGISLKFALTR